MRPWILRREIALWLALLQGRARPAHRLPGPLLISVTSHPPRYKYLRQALLSLLVQTVRPDAIVLWIEHGDLARLPLGVRALRRFGLRILPCEDGLRSYKKIIPALEQFPHAYVATADDDQLYPRDWLLELAEATDPRTIAYGRGHRMKLSVDGTPSAYREWDWEIARQSAGDIVVPTGVGGVLYPPDAFDPRVLDRAEFRALAPTLDDLWLCWMARLRGTGYCKVAPQRLPVPLPTANIASLSAVNNGEPMGNDAAVAALHAKFGLPGAPRPAGDAGPR